MKTVKIFDTTLRDGEQAPGFSMTVNEKVRMAKALDQMGVDVIEAGFAIASNGDFTSIKAISKAVARATVASLARLEKNDIDTAWESVREAQKPRLHVFIATSDIHMKAKLHMTEKQVLEAVKKYVSYARSLCSEIEFSAEDATRSDRDFLKKVFIEAKNAGADILNIPDTVGYSTPEEMFELVQFIKNTPELSDAQISVHCHNDLGLAVANTLSAILAGADQAECAVNGIGERAGNAALEEIVMNLRSRQNYYNADTKVDTSKIIHVSKLLTLVTGVKVQPNKAITGENAFAHEAGIHQHGMLQNRSTYEIISPESVGLTENKIVLGKHSGRHAFEDKLHSMGYQLEKVILDELFIQFKDLADKKKTVSDKDLEALLKSQVLEIPEVYKLDKYVLNSSNVLASTCSIRLKKNGEKTPEGYAMGTGPIEAAFNAINNALNLNIVLREYNIKAVTEGIDAQGAVSVRIEFAGHVFKGYGVDQNIFDASIKAYISSINNMVYQLNPESGK